MKTEKLVMIPGPTPVARSIQEQMGRPTVAFGDPDFVTDFKEVLADLKEMWRCDGQVFVIAGSGTLAMEMSLANTTKQGDYVLLCSNGFFGDRFIKMCKRKGLNLDVIEAPKWGESVTAKMVEEKMASKKYSAVLATHVETSTGVAAPIEEIGQVLAKYPDTIYIVDGVAASAGVREYLKDMNIDVLFSCSQKAFGVAPGLAIMWASSKAVSRRESLGELIPESYVDFKEWAPVMTDPSKYWGTPPINLIWALKESVRIIKEEGLEERYDRHVLWGQSFDNAMEALGFVVAAQRPYRAPTLSVYMYPEGVDDVLFRKVLAEEGVMSAGCLGPFAGKGLRLGHMGNIDKHIMVSAVAAVERACVRCGLPVQVGAGVAQIQSGFLSK